MPSLLGLPTEPTAQAPPSPPYSPPIEESNPLWTEMTTVSLVGECLLLMAIAISRAKAQASNGYTPLVSGEIIALCVPVVGFCSLSACICLGCDGQTTQSSADEKGRQQWLHRWCQHLHLLFAALATQVAEDGQ